MAIGQRPETRQSRLSESELEQARGGASEAAPKPGSPPVASHLLILPYLEQEN